MIWPPFPISFGRPGVRLQYLKSSEAATSRAINLNYCYVRFQKNLVSSSFLSWLILFQKAFAV